MKIKMMDFLKSHADEVITNCLILPEVVEQDYAIYKDEMIGFRVNSIHGEDDVIYCFKYQPLDGTYKHQNIGAIGFISTQAEHPDNLLSELDELKCYPLRAMIEKRILKEKVKGL